MKILHIIPSAFDYFSDIRERAFVIVEGLDNLGWKNEVITLQYGAPTRAEQFQLQQAAPSRKYQGENNLEEVEKVDFENCDLLHAHVPFLGAAGKILKWKNKHLQKPLVVSYYRDINLTDVFAFFFRLYNLFYLPKIFKVAEAVTLFPDTNVNRRMENQLHQVSDKVLLLGANKSENEAVTAQDIVLDLDMLYNNLIH